MAVPAVAAALMSLVEQSLGVNGSSALFVIVVLLVSRFGGIAPAVLSAIVSGLLLNYYFTPTLYSFTIAEPANVISILVLLVVAVAVAVLVDASAKRARQARRASREAELLTSFAGSVLRGDDLPALLERLRETYSQCRVSILRASSGPVSSVGEHPPATVNEATTLCEVGDGMYTLLLSGPELHAHDRRVLSAVANQAVAGMGYWFMT